MEVCHSVQQHEVEVEEVHRGIRAARRALAQERVAWRRDVTQPTSSAETEVTEKRHAST